MKKMISLIICVLLLFTSCGANTKSGPEQTVENDEVIEALFDNKNLNDEELLSYVEDLVYEETIKDLNSEDYVVEEVRAIYISEEYLEELAYNDQSNLYFGYTLEELDSFFQGTRYIYTLGADGKTTVQELQEIEDVDGEEILKNLAVGTGVIVVCVTISFVTAGAGAPVAVTTVFTASAKTGAAFAVSSGVFGAVSAGIVEGYKTGDIKEALKASAVSGSEGFKWGAIIGCVAGGGKEAFLLKKGTKGGLTMSEVAMIQKESGYPIEVIARFNSMKQYKICKKAGLSAKMVNGKTALVRDIDLNYVDDMTGKTNLQLMQEGKAPIDPTGQKYELHHIGQKNDSPLAILTRAEHRGKGNDSIWHTLTEGFENPAKSPNWKSTKENFWKAYAEMVQGGI